MLQNDDKYEQVMRLVFSDMMIKRAMTQYGIDHPSECEKWRPLAMTREKVTLIMLQQGLISSSCPSQSVDDEWNLPPNPSRQSTEGLASMSTLATLKRSLETQASPLLVSCCEGSCQEEYRAFASRETMPTNSRRTIAMFRLHLSKQPGFKEAKETLFPFLQLLTEMEVGEEVSIGLEMTCLHCSLLDLFVESTGLQLVMVFPWIFSEEICLFPSTVIGKVCHIRLILFPLSVISVITEQVAKKKASALKTAEQWGSISSQSANSLAGPECTQKLFERLCCQNLRGITMGVPVNTHSYNCLYEYYKDVNCEYKAHQEELEAKQFPFTFASPMLTNFAHYHMTREDEMELYARHNIGNRTIFAGNVVLPFLIEKTNSNSVFPVERGDLFMMQLNGINDSFIIICKQGHYTNGSLFNLVNTSFDVTYVCNTHYTPHFLACGNDAGCSHTFSFSFSIPHEGDSVRSNMVMLGFGMVLSHEQDWPQGGQVEKDGYCRFTQYIEMPGLYMATVTPKGEVMHRMFVGRCCHNDYHVFAMDRPSENMVDKHGEIVNICDFANDAPVRYCLDCSEIEHITTIPSTTVRKTDVYNLEVPLVLQKIETYNSFHKEEH